jgi:hypothetical protein
MTTPSTPRKAGPLLGTGAQTSWPFTFKVFAASDIAVTIANNLGVETALVLNADYSVTLNSNQDTSPGGTVTYPISGSALPSGSRLTIFGNLPYDQPLDLPSGGNFSPLALENQLDRLTMQIQQLREQVGRALQVSVTSSADVRLPAPSANELIGWDSTGSNLANVPLSDLATALAYGNFRYDTFTGDGVETQFTLSVDPATLGNLDVSIAGVVQVPVADYTLVAGKLVFSSAPPLGATILARYGEAIPSLPGSEQISFVQSGTGAVTRTVQGKLREVVSVLDFDADPTGAADSSAAITNALAQSNHVVVPPGTYRCDAMIELLTGKTLQLMGGVTLIRKAAHSTSTEPVVWIKGSDASFFGSGQASSTVITENRAPRGVVSLGHKDMSESHGNVTYCTLKDMTISGAVVYGQTTGAADAALLMANPQFNGLASYFHNVTGIRVQHANIGIWLLGWANGNTISNIQGYKLGNPTFGVNRNVFIACSGALDNAVSNVFFHQSPSSIGLLVEQLDNTPNGGFTHNPEMNSFSGMVFEQGGTLAIGLKSLITGGASFYELRSNVNQGNSYPSGFLNNNVLIDLLAVRSATVDAATVSARTIVTAPTANISVDAAVAGTLRLGNASLMYVAKKAKFAGAGGGGATLTFTLSNNVQDSIYKHGYIKITAGGGLRGSTSQSVAWYMYGASALNAAFPTLGSLKDSGGDISDFTISMTSGVLTVATTLNDIVIEVEYGFTTPNVNVT